MKNIIFGIGDFADVLFEKVIGSGGNVDAFCIDREYASNVSIDIERPLIFYEDLKLQYTTEDKIGIYLGVIGKKTMFEQRRMAYERIKNDGFVLLNYVDSSAIVNTDDIGDGNIIMENVVVESHCKIGNGNIIWPNVVMPHHNTIGSFNNISPSVSFSGYSSVGNQCFIGNNACLNNHVHIFDKGLVGAGVFARNDLKPSDVLVTAEAYVLKDRKSWEFK